MIAQELEVSLHMAFMEARQKRHEFITVEHLLLALLDNPSASEVLRACAADIDELRKLLTDFVTEHTPIPSRCTLSMICVACSRLMEEKVCNTDTTKSIGV